MKKILSLILTILVCACGSATPVPGWKDKAYQQLEIYKTSFLTGREGSSEPHFVKASREMAAGNDLDLLIIAYLTKYALHTASLESFDSSEFAKLYRLQPNAAHMAYCHFLKGNFTAVDIKALPNPYAGLLQAAEGKDAVAAAREITAIDDPLSRLIACGVWVKYKPFDETILQIAIETASAHGWRRPLWAYLNQLQQYYSDRGETAQSLAVKERLELLKKQ